MFFWAHFFHCLALYFCFVHTSSTISFYISLGSYPTKFATPLPLWQLAFVVVSYFVFCFVYMLVLYMFIYLVSCVGYYVHIFKMFFPCILHCCCCLQLFFSYNILFSPTFTYCCQVICQIVFHFFFFFVSCVQISFVLFLF